MNTSIQPASISDVFGINRDDSFFTQRVFGVNNGRISQPPVRSYDEILKNMNLNKKIEDIPKSENEIKDLDESEKLKNDSINLSKKITTTRQKCKEINLLLEKAKEELSNLQNVRNNCMKFHAELISLLILNESTIESNPEFINKLLNESNIVEDKIIENIKKLEDEREQLTKLLSSLTSFINESLKSEMTEDELAAIQSGKKCGICIENDIDTAFSSCGHTACGTCASNLGRCHMCRTEVLHKIKLYFS